MLLITNLGVPMMIGMTNNCVICFYRFCNLLDTYNILLQWFLIANFLWLDYTSPPDFGFKLLRCTSTYWCHRKMMFESLTGLGTIKLVKFSSNLFKPNVCVVICKHKHCNQLNIFCDIYFKVSVLFRKWFLWKEICIIYSN